MCSADLRIFELGHLIDSSNAEPADWVRLASVVATHVANPDVIGVVVVHGTDTLSYTAAALTFLLENPHKPVVVTGAQLPIEGSGSDGVLHLYDACRIAACRPPQLFPDVCVYVSALHPPPYRRRFTLCVRWYRYFNRKLMRGTRVEKTSASAFDAFNSPRVPEIATAEGDGFVFNEMLINEILAQRMVEDSAIEPGPKHLIQILGAVHAAEPGTIDSPSPFVNGRLTWSMRRRCGGHQGLPARKRQITSPTDRR